MREIRQADHLSFLSSIEQRYRKERLRFGPRAAVLAEDEEAAVMTAIRDVCAYYRCASAEERDALRRFFADSYVLRHRLFTACGEAARRFEVTGSTEELIAALAALSLEDAVTDYRDTILAVGGLRAAASRLGLDAQPAFERVMEISSPRMQSLLR